jgi:hypothetical protein
MCSSLQYIPEFQSFKLNQVFLLILTSTTMATSTKEYQDIDLPPAEYEKESQEPLSRTSSQSAQSTHSSGDFF